MRGLDGVVEVANEYQYCEACPALCETRGSVIVGGGNVYADLMVIGESPGALEDEFETPFVGSAGKLLMELFRSVWPEDKRLLELQDIPKGDDDKYFSELRDFLDDYIFWTNILCCWPGEGNRDPSAKEIKACMPRLHKLIYAVDPVLIIVLGRVALSSLLGKKMGILDKRGTLFDVPVPSPATGKPVRYSVMATLHPSFLLRKGDQDQVTRKTGHTYETQEDLRYALWLLNSEYQNIFGTSFPNKPQEYKK